MGIALEYSLRGHALSVSLGRSLRCVLRGNALGIYLGRFLGGCILRDALRRSVLRIAFRRRITTGRRGKTIVHEIDLLCFKIFDSEITEAGRASERSPRDPPERYPQ